MMTMAIATAQVAVAMEFVALCVAVWIGFFLPALLGVVGPEADKDGLYPTYLSLPWLWLQHVGDHPEVVGYAPGTLSWWQEVKRQKAAREEARLQAQRDELAEYEEQQVCRRFQMRRWWRRWRRWRRWFREKRCQWWCG